MRSQLFVHRNNSISLSYERNKITKQKFQTYISSQLTEEENSNRLIQHEPYMYVHSVKNGIYLSFNDHMFTYCSPMELKRIYHQSDQLYFYLMKHLKLNFFDLDKRIVNTTSQHMEYVSTTSYYPEDILDINLNYYKIYIKGKYYPVYLQDDAKVFDETGQKKSIMEVVHKMGNRRLLGLNYNHQVQEFEIEKINNVNHEDEDDFTLFDTPFYSIGVGVLEPTKRTLPILIDNILVDILD